jgi:cell division protease FtsH
MMNHRSPNKPGSPNGRKPNDRMIEPKVLIMWLVIFVSILGLATFGNSAESVVQKLTVNEVVTLASKGMVSKGVMVSDARGGESWYRLDGTLRAAPVDAEGVPESKAVQRFRAEGRMTAEDFEALRLHFSEKRANNWASDLLTNLLPVLLIVGIVYFVFVRQIRSAGKGAMAFGKSKAKMLTRDKDRVTFKDVAGCDESKEEVREVVDFLKDPKKFQKIGGKIPKGILMVGPPGTGKTLLAKAVAGEADVPFFSISGSDFVEMFVGVGAARVRDMFEQGRKHAPCIIFIDEIDAVGRQRGAGLGGGNDEREQTLNSLLVEMDGFDGHEGVIIIAATNRPDVLDSALLRPGRFDRQVTIDVPDLSGRESILKVHARKIKVGKDVDLHRVARATVGFAGADLANLLNESALLAARYNKSEVSMAEVEEAHDKIRFGRERRRLMDDEDKKMTAYHEAGHAILQVLLKCRKVSLHKVTILPRGRALGLTMYTPLKDILGESKNELLDRICMIMGGRIGEEVITGDFSNGASMDLKQATKIARHMVCDWGMSDLGPVAFGDNQDHIFLGREISRTQNYSEESARRIDEAIVSINRSQYDRAFSLIHEHKDALIKIADGLLEHETLEGRHVEEILEFGEIRSPVLVNRPTEQDREKEESTKPSGKGGVVDQEGGLSAAGVPA